MEIIHLVFDKTDPISKKLGLSVDQLAREQVKAGYSVTLWEMCLTHNEDFQDRPYKTIPFHIKTFQWSITNEMTEAVNRLKKGTVVHLHGAFIPLFFTLAFQLNKLKCYQ